MKARGFLLAGPMLYAAIGAGVIIAGLSLALKIQSSRLETCRVEFGAFKLETKRLGDAAEKAAKEREQRDQKAKERTDAAHKTAVARLNRDVQRLRDDNARRSILPPAPPGARDPQTACFNRPELDRAVSGFIGGVTSLVAEGAEGVAGLDAAKVWAQAL